MTDPEPKEAARLEELWAGEFGGAYADRNRVLDERRAAFWTGLLERYPIRSVLEVGCGQGGNLAPIARVLEPADVWGVDLNLTALARAREHAPGINVVTAKAPAAAVPRRVGRPGVHGRRPDPPAGRDRCRT